MAADVDQQGNDYGFDECGNDWGEYDWDDVDSDLSANRLEFQDLDTTPEHSEHEYEYIPMMIQEPEGAAAVGQVPMIQYNTPEESRDHPGAYQDLAGAVLNGSMGFTEYCRTLDPDGETQEVAVVHHPAAPVQEALPVGEVGLTWYDAAQQTFQETSVWTNKHSS